MSNTVRAAVLTGYATLARTLGLDPVRMLEAAGIPLAALTDPDLRISTSAARNLLEQSSRAAEDFGLRMYDLRTPSIWGPLALVVREQPTVRGALEALARYSRLYTDATLVELEEVDDVVVLRILLQFGSPGPVRQTVELTLGQLARLLRGYLGPNWRPLSVSLTHSAPRDLTNHHRILGPTILFDQDFNGFVLNRAELEQPNPAADPWIAREVERYVVSLGGPANSLAKRVEAVVLSRLANGPCTAEWAAGRVGADLRTLQRQLAAEGTSFLKITQSVRMTLLAQYLEATDRPLAEVAELLGFSALSAFSRWHKALYGYPPSRHRDKARAASSGSR